MLEREMRKAEAGHLILFLLMFSLIGYALARGWPDAAGWLLLINILLNGYPATLQRYNRFRLERALAHATGSQPQQRHAQQHKYQP
jgi:hypothetical protein